MDRVYRAIVAYHDTFGSTEETLYECDVTLKRGNAVKKKCTLVTPAREPDGYVPISQQPVAALSDKNVTFQILKNEQYLQRYLQVTDEQGLFGNTGKKKLNLVDKAEKATTFTIQVCDAEQGIIRINENNKYIKCEQFLNKECKVELEDERCEKDTYAKFRIGTEGALKDKLQNVGKQDVIFEHKAAAESAIAMTNEVDKGLQWAVKIIPAKPATPE